MDGVTVVFSSLVDIEQWTHLNWRSHYKHILLTISPLVCPYQALKQCQ